MANLAGANITTYANISGAPSEAADITIATILLITTALGVPANVLSLGYFCTRKPRNSNGMFFKRVYAIITVVDCLICVVQFPIIQHLFNQRSGSFFKYAGHGYLVVIWFTIYRALILTSISLVAVLSVSRSLLLVYPRKTLPLPSAWIIPGSVATLTAGASTVFASFTIATETVIVMTCIMGCAFLLISISFVFSILSLKRARKRAAETNASTDEHDQATVTVIIVTFLYVVCNIPALMYAVLYLAIVDPSPVAVTLLEYLYYIAANVLTATNSTLNPVVYFWTMKYFRGFLLRILE